MVSVHSLIAGASYLEQCYEQQGRMSQAKHLGQPAAASTDHGPGVLVLCCPVDVVEVLSWIDVCAGLAAKTLAHGPCVTVSVDAVHFFR